MRSFIISYKYMNKMFRERFGTFVHTTECIHAEEISNNILSDLHERMLDIKDMDGLNFAIDKMWEITGEELIPVGELNAS